MGLFDWFSKILGGKSDETPDDVGERLDRIADRFENAGDEESATEARNAAKEARRKSDGETARRVEARFLRDNGLRPDGRPLKPILGRGPDDNDYVRYGTEIRNGGSKTWRYNNPGYVRCSSRTTSYGALSCDGEYAIFPDYDTGVRAMQQSLRDDYPDLPLREALEKHLPPEAGIDPDKICREAGLDPTSKVEDLTPEAFDAFGNAIQCQPSWSEGESFDRQSDSAPDWVDSVWDAPDSSGDSGSGSGGDDGDSGSSESSVTDNS